MCMSLGEYAHIAGRQAYRRLITDFDVTFSFGDQMKNHHPFGPGFEQGRGRTGAGRLLAPGRRELGVDENSAHQAHDAQGLRQCIHQEGSTSTVTAMGTPVSTAAGMGEQRRLWSTNSRNRSGEIPEAQIRTCSCTSPGPAKTGSPPGSNMPNMPRVSERLRAWTSRRDSSM